LLTYKLSNSNFLFPLLKKEGIKNLLIINFLKYNRKLFFEEFLNPISLSLQGEEKRERGLENLSLNLLITKRKQVKLLLNNKKIVFILSIILSLVKNLLLKEEYNHENILIPVGTAIIKVAAVKYALVSTSNPTVYM